MSAKEIVKVKDIEVTFQTFHSSDYISLTDIARYKNTDTGLVISHWLSTKYTIEFLGIWERIHNPSFNVTEFSNIKNEAGSNGFVLSGKQWIDKTKAIGLISKVGRYGGGTYAHKDIAFEFASWISAEFKLYLIKEFERLKSAEYTSEKLEWSARRMISKTNYRIHTDAIKDNLPKNLTEKQINIAYANEADVLNIALFNMTASDWRLKNKGKKGNIRDEATIQELVVLANLESYNAEMIRQKISQPERLRKLNPAAITQLKSLLGNSELKKIE